MAPTVVELTAALTDQGCPLGDGHLTADRPACHAVLRRGPGSRPTDPAGGSSAGAMPVTTLRRDDDRDLASIPPAALAAETAVPPMVARIGEHPYVRLASDARFVAFWLDRRSACSATGCTRSPWPCSSASPTRPSRRPWSS